MAHTDKKSHQSLYDDAKWSKRQIAKELGVPRTTVHRLLDSENSRRDGRERKGKSQQLASQDIDKLIEMVTEGRWKTRTYTWEASAKDSGLNVCKLYIL